MTIHTNSGQNSFDLAPPKMSDGLLEKLRLVSAKVSFSSGSIIYAQDNTADAVYCIENGIVKLSHVLEDGYESVLSLYSARNIIGEMSSFTNGALNPMATAITDVEALMLSAGTVRQLILRESDFAEFIIRTLVQKLCCTTHQTFIVSGKSVFRRVAHVLQILSSYGFLPDEEGWYNITHAELASLIGTTRSQVTICLDRLAQDGVIVKLRNRLKITNPSMLQALSR